MSLLIDYNLPIVQQYVEKHKLQQDEFLTPEQFLLWEKNFTEEKYNREKNYPNFIRNSYDDEYRDNDDKKIRATKYKFARFNLDCHCKRMSYSKVKQNRTLLYLEDIQHQQALRYITQHQQAYQPDNQKNLYCFEYCFGWRDGNYHTKKIFIRGASFHDAKIKFMLNINFKFITGESHDIGDLFMKDQRLSFITINDILGQTIINPIPQIPITEHDYQDNLYYKVTVDNRYTFTKILSLIIRDIKIELIKDTIIIV